MAAAGSQTPRTPDGHPDLQGFWANATLTPVERPPIFAGKPTVTDKEARAFEKQNVDFFNLLTESGFEMARINGVKRSSLIVDPVDGKIPYRHAATAQIVNSFDSAADRPLGERCLLGFGSTAGPPMMPVLENDNYQIVQTPDYIMILVEMVHDVRIVRMNATHQPARVRLWLGDSIGHWDGDTLVVDTTNFTDKTRFRGASPGLHVIERFTRTGTKAFLYQVTIEDPATFSRQWTMEYPFRAAAGPVFEYACHEGNYVLADILGGARKEDAARGKK
ncbi:MAG TPA: hypothetical protein VG273_26440 [Bryobacteraceae bacterium]|jgi:hypothetical protein|nr:hypothetical protein [Bryobacteraceae bacterium]